MYNICVNMTAVLYVSAGARCAHVHEKIWHQGLHTLCGAGFSFQEQILEMIIEDLWLFGSESYWAADGCRGSTKGVLCVFRPV